MDHGAWCAFLRDLGELNPEHAECPDADTCQSVVKYHRPALRLVKG